MVEEAERARQDELLSIAIRMRTELMMRARSALGNIEDAREVFNSVLYRVWAHADQWRMGETGLPEERAKRAWISGIARNYVIDEIRRRKRQIVTEELTYGGGEEKDHATRSSPAHIEETPQLRAVMETEFRCVLERALPRLHRRHRIVFELYYFSEMGNREIASFLHMNENTVKVWLFRAKRALREDRDLRMCAATYGIGDCDGQDGAGQRRTV